MPEMKCPKCGLIVEFLYEDNRGRHNKLYFRCTCGKTFTKRLDLIPNMAKGRY